LALGQSKALAIPGLVLSGAMVSLLAFSIARAVLCL